MGDILRRRGMMALPSSSPTLEWDYEWDSTKGLLNANNNGWTYNTVGSTGYACIIEDDYLRFRGSSANYKYYSYPRTFATGVMEAEIYVATNAVMLIAFSNGEHSIGANLRSAGIYLGTGTSTLLQSASAATKYKIRLVLKNGLLGDVYVNDVLKAEDVDISTNTVTNIRVTGRGSGSGNVYSRLYSLKMKFNRTE